MDDIHTARTFLTLRQLVVAVICPAVFLHRMALMVDRCRAQSSPEPAGRVNALLSRRRRAQSPSLSPTNSPVSFGRSCSGAAASENGRSEWRKERWLSATPVRAVELLNSGIQARWKLKEAANPGGLNKCFMISTEVAQVILLGIVR